MNVEYFQNLYTDAVNYIKNQFKNLSYENKVVLSIALAIIATISIGLIIKRAFKAKVQPKTELDKKTEDTATQVLEIKNEKESKVEPKESKVEAKESEVELKEPVLDKKQVSSESPEEEELIFEGNKDDDGIYKKGTLKKKDREGFIELNGEFKLDGSGKGKTITSTGITREGTFGPSGLEGKGKITKGNLTVEGIFKKDRLHDLNGSIVFEEVDHVFTYEDEEIFGDIKFPVGIHKIEGNFEEGIFTEGTTTYFSGEIQKGKFVDLLLHDPKGERIAAEGGKETGPFEGGVLHGENGQRVLPDGFKYVGKFEKGIQVGKGQMFLDDQVWDGIFVNGQLNGPGTHTTPTYTYKGPFVNGEYDGEDGEIANLDRTEVLKGKFEKGYLIEGKMQLPDRSYYRGTFNKAGRLDGVDCLWVLPDGQKHKGTFKDGELQEGSKVDADGNITKFKVKGKVASNTLKKAYTNTMKRQEKANGNARIEEWLKNFDAA